MDVYGLHKCRTHVPGNGTWMGLPAIYNRGLDPSVPNLSLDRVHLLRKHLANGAKLQPSL